MATVFRDRNSKQILRIDLGKPSPEIYAEKERLTDWEAEIVDDKTAMELASVTFPDSDPGPIIDPKEVFRNATLDEKVRILGQKMGLS